MGAEKGVLVQEPAGWRILRRDRDGGTWLVPVDTEGKPTIDVPTPEEQRAAEAKAAEEAAQKLARAYTLWRTAAKGPLGQDDGPVRAYLASRGLTLRVPASIGFHGAAPLWVEEGEKGKFENRPAMVAAVGHWPGGRWDAESGGRKGMEFAGLHVTFLERAGGAGDGGWARRPGAGRRYLGSCRGVVQVGGDLSRGVLCLGEGLETCMHVAQATGLATWAALDAGRLQRLALPYGLLRPHGGPIHTVIVLVDLDTWKQSEKSGKASWAWPAGQHHAPLAANNIAAQAMTTGGAGGRLHVYTRWPTARLLPGLVEPAVPGPPGREEHVYDLPKGGLDATAGIDWDDVGRMDGGADLVRRGVLEGVDLDENGRLDADGQPWGEMVLSTDDGPVQVAGGRAVARDALVADSGGAGVEGGADGPPAEAGGGGGSGGGDGEAAGGDGDGGQGGGGRRRILNADPLAIARRFLLDEAWRRADGSLHPHPLLVRWAGAWWGYSEGHWSRLGEAGGDNEGSLRAVVWHYLQASWRRMERANGPDEIMPFRPKPDEVKAVVEALAVDTTLQGVEAAPAWLPTRVGDGGKPKWGLTATLAACASGAATIRVQEHAAKRSQELGGLQAETVVAYLDGLVDVSRMRYGAKVAAARRPHTPDLFVTSVLPYPFPAAAAQRVLDAGPDIRAWWYVMEGELEALAPHFLRWVKSASGMAKALDGGSDEDVQHALEWIRQLAQMMGDTVDEDRSVEKIFVCQGPGRAGKGTIADCVELAVGVRNVAAMRAADWEDKFGLVTMIGRRAALFRDLHIGKHADTAAIVEMAKMVSGQDRMQIRDIYSKATANVRLRCRVWWFANVLPTSLRDQSTAFAGRLLVLPMRWGFQGREDPSIKAGIAGEGQGVHLFALSGLAMLRSMARRQIEVCADAEDARAEYEQSTSPTAAFVRECCLVWPPSPAAIAELDAMQRASLPSDGEGGLSKAGWRVPFDELYLAYCGFCRSEGVTPAGKQRFSAEIRPLVPEWRHRADNGQGLPQARQPNGLPQRMAPGIIIRPGVRLGGDAAEPGQDSMGWG